MNAKSQALGEYFTRLPLAVAAAIACGVFTGFCIPNCAARAADERAEAAVQRGLVYLATRQADDGSYGSDVYRGHVAVTAFVSRAMMASGSRPGQGPYGERLSKSVAYLLGRMRQNGLITSKDAKEPAPMYGHAFALMYLAECRKAASKDEIPKHDAATNETSKHEIPKDEMDEKIERAVKLIVKSQNKEGGWRYLPKPGDADLSVTVTQLLALSAVRDAGIEVPKDVIDRAIDYVKKSQNDDGGFRYLLLGGTSGFARSAAAVTALYRAGEAVDREEVRKGFDYVARFPAGATVGQPEVFYFYGDYYAAQVMSHAPEAAWERWFAAVRDRLLDQQSKDGSWPDAASAELGTAMACLTLQTKPAK